MECWFNYSKIEKRKKYDDRRVSEAVGKSPSHIAQIEQGSRRLGINLLYELITVLETDANTILLSIERIRSYQLIKN